MVIKYNATPTLKKIMRPFEYHANFMSFEAIASSFSLLSFHYLINVAAIVVICFRHVRRWVLNYP